ncbi:MAG: hypothetical protein LC808_43135 [Actinobacteria bacterium]|nr:hypothetical protein [Actinomycetota bacterium]
MPDQERWRFCDKCYGMFYEPTNTNRGHCPAGGGHNAAGFKFELPYGEPETPTTQR